MPPPDEMRNEFPSIALILEDRREDGMRGVPQTAIGGTVVTG